MLRQKELYYTDQILRQISGILAPFGGFAVLLVSDPAQIPAVLGRVVWDSSTRGSTEADDFGRILYTGMFNQVIELTEVRRLDNIPEAVVFLEILDRLRDGECTKADWLLVCQTRSKSTMGPVPWNQRFDDNADDVTYLFNTNKEVNQYNNKRLTQIQKPIALIEAQHTGKSKSM